MLVAEEILEDIRGGGNALFNSAIPIPNNEASTMPWIGMWCIIS